MASTYRQVGYGSTGSAVSKLQTVLNEHGYGLAVDGIFGAKTQAAVRDYQKKNGLKLEVNDVDAGLPSHFTPTSAWASPPW